MIGACGGVGTTAVLGLAALRRKLIDPSGMVTALPLFTALDRLGTGSGRWWSLRYTSRVVLVRYYAQCQGRSPYVGKP